MLRQETLYLDTSVLSAYYDEQKPERQNLTVEFWAKLGSYRVYISSVTIKEIRDFRELSKQKALLELIKGLEEISIIPEVEGLADEYIKAGIFSERFRNDALHIAVATVNGVDYLVSWNFQHIVKVKTKTLVPAVNVLKGYLKSPLIISPPEL